jgi:hypothetical protein
MPMLFESGKPKACPVEKQQHLLPRPRRRKNTIAHFLSPKARKSRLDILRGLARKTKRTKEKTLSGKTVKSVHNSV